MHGKFTTAVLAAAFALGAVPGTAFAVTETKSRAVVAEARGKIEANDKAGMTGSAADAQNRAREALARAEKATREDKEHRALYEARAAAALAGLAQATAELNQLTAQRDAITAR